MKLLHTDAPASDGEGDGSDQKEERVEQAGNRAGQLLLPHLLLFLLQKKQGSLYFTVANLECKTGWLPFMVTVLKVKFFFCSFYDVISVRKTGFR